MDLLAHWEIFDFKTAVVVFFAYLIIDGLYAYYTISINKKKPFRSATIGSTLHVCIALGVLTYTQNYLYILPLALGSWVGTYLVVRNDLATSKHRR